MIIPVAGPGRSGEIYVGPGLFIKPGSSRTAMAQMGKKTGTSATTMPRTTMVRGVPTRA